jgi:hypothetical protein
VPVVAEAVVYLTTEEAGAYLKLAPQTLEAARHKADGSGPPYIKLPRAVRYRRSQLDAWMAKHDHPPDRPAPENRRRMPARCTTVPKISSRAPSGRA